MPGGMNVFKGIQEFLNKTTLSDYIESFHKPVAAVPKEATVAAVLQVRHAGPGGRQAVQATVP